MDRHTLTRLLLFFALCGGLAFAQPSFRGVESVNTYRNAAYCADTSGAANTITCKTAVGFVGYVTGQSVDLLLANSVTGAATINIDSLGAKAVTYNGATPLVSGIMSTGGTYRLQYDGTEFVLQGNVNSSIGGAQAVTQLIDFAITNTSPTVQTMCALCSPTLPAQTGTGIAQFIMTAPVTATISGTSASDTVFWYTMGGTLWVGMNGAETITCSAGCSVASPVTAFPPGSVKLWATTITANVWDTITPATMDFRSAFSTVNILPGTGISSVTDPTTGFQTLSATGGSPGSPANSIQFNNAGTFGGSNCFYDKTNIAVVCAGSATGFTPVIAWESGVQWTIQDNNFAYAAMSAGGNGGTEFDYNSFGGTLGAMTNSNPGDGILDNDFSAYYNGSLHEIAKWLVHITTANTDGSLNAFSSINLNRSALYCQAELNGFSNQCVIGTVESGGDAASEATNTLVVEDLDGDGITTSVVRAGPSQSTNDLQEWQGASKSVLSRITDTGGYSGPTITTTGTNFAGLGTPANGTQEYCSDCQVTSSIDNTCAATGSGAQALRINGVWKCFTSTPNPPHQFSFNLNGSPIATGAVGLFPGAGPYSGTINRVDISGGGTAGAACSITVDIWKANAAIPTSGGLISASAPATLSSANLNQSGSLSGWTTSVAANDVFGASVATNTGCITAIVQVFYQ